jgi:hypothetical protein
MKVEGFFPMSDSVILVCAVCASLATGVLAAYGVCLSMFAAFRMGVRKPTAESMQQVGGAASIVEG